jgi:hypothetical protein
MSNQRPAPVVHPVQRTPSLHYTVWVPAVVQLVHPEHDQGDARRAFLDWADQHLGEWDIVARAVAFARIGVLPVLLYRWRWCTQSDCRSPRHPAGLRTHYEPTGPTPPKAVVAWRGLEVALPARRRAIEPLPVLALPGDGVPLPDATVPPERRRR